MPNEELDAVRSRVLTENTAQAVLKNLQNLRSNQDHLRERWVWELLQNARDAKAVSVSVGYDEGKVVFRHDGARFTGAEITHLIYHGSTKIEDADTIGQYGSGFLTTHLLSPEIRVSGGFEDGRRFRFRLKRELGSVASLTRSMEQSWDDFSNSLAHYSESDDAGTEFLYPLDGGDSDARKAVAYGIAMLKRCAPFVVVFNDGFASIKIQSRSETTTFKAKRRAPLAKERSLHEVVVEEVRNQNRVARRYIVAQGESAQVAIPLESDGNDTICAPIRKIPKLFLGFPLIGTESFGFPAVINSLKFTPTEQRDGVFLGRSADAVNAQNQKAVEEACALLAELVEFAAASGWRNICELANIPEIVNRDWLNRKWLESTVNRLFVEKIRRKAIALNGSGERIHPNALKLPFADTPVIADKPDGVLPLWDLLADWNGYEEVLPRRDESVGWRDAVESWKRITNNPLRYYREAVIGNNLAAIAAAGGPDINGLRLKDGVSPIAWLDKLIGFLMGNEMSNAVRMHRIVPSQAGFLYTLLDLHRDKGIDEELKNIADLADEWRIRPKLRDAQIVSLSDEIGAGDWNNAMALGALIRNIDARAEENPDEACREASARLFAWIVGRQDWIRLRELPMFSEEYQGGSNRQALRNTLKIGNLANPNDAPLAPIASWADGLQAYSDLFPQRHILASEYFEAVPDVGVWNSLAEMDWVRNNIIVAKETLHSRFLPDADKLADDKNHETSSLVSLTDIAFITRDEVGIMERVRRSRPLATTFWRFLTEWMTKHDSDGLEINEALCDCGETHCYYPAEWLIPVSVNKWVPFSSGGTRGARQADAQSLADLLRGSGWSPDSLNDSPATVKLLESIGVTQFDLTRSFMATTDEERNEQDRIFTEILASTGGDLNPVREFAEDLKQDPDLRAHLAKRRESLRITHGNQRLGELVEQLVKQSLEDEGFRVKNTHVGADLEIEVGDAARIDLARRGKTWLIEVKATRDQRVRMTDRQAREAVGKGDGFLLCVVPLDSEQSDPELDDVRASMRFVANMGARLHELHKGLNDFDRLQKGDSNGVQLEVQSGAVRVRIANSVWQNDGFPLEDLLGNLV